MLEVRNVNKKFSNGKGVHGISLSVQQGKPLALLGKNGAGKTTTIKLILGLISADAGEIHKGKNVTVSYLPEERGIYNDITVYENMKFFSKLKGVNKTKISKNIKTLAHEFKFEEYLNYKVNLLSKGNMQKVQLAIAFLGNEDILILDEPFSGLDPINRAFLSKILKKKLQNKIVIISSHQLDLIEEICTDICILNNGAVKYYGSITDLLKTQNRILTFNVASEKISKNFEIDKQLNIKEQVIKYIDKEIDSEDFEIRFTYPNLQEVYVKMMEV